MQICMKRKHMKFLQSVLKTWKKMINERGNKCRLHNHEWLPEMLEEKKKYHMKWAEAYINNRKVLVHNIFTIFL